MSARDEDETVLRLLALAQVEEGPERIGQVGMAAYRSLAEARGLPLETVVRAAVRGDLASVVGGPGIESRKVDEHGSAVLRTLTGDVHTVDGPDAA